MAQVVVLWRHALRVRMRKVFEGTAEQMYKSLQKLAALPDETKVYCGHEYTLANVQFALRVDPRNAALQERERRSRALREAGKPTLPSTLGEERATNPFLRCLEPAVIDSANDYLGARISDPVRVFAAIREWKNRASAQRHRHPLRAALGMRDAACSPCYLSRSRAAAAPSAVFEAPKAAAVAQPRLRRLPVEKPQLLDATRLPEFDGERQT
jgi:hypothetical protein